MKPSQACMDLIKKHEGCRLEAYPDPGTGGDPWTCGFGATGPGICPGVVWTEAQARARLQSDANRACTSVLSLVKVPLTQNQLDALTCFVFNVGKENFENSTLLRKLNAGDSASAADEFLRWNHAAGKVLPGLTERRAAERTLFLKA